MNIVLQDYIDTFDDADDNGKFDLIVMFNQPGFVEGLKEEGVTPEEITGFFKTICKDQIVNNRPLANFGYMDLLSFSKLHDLF